MHLVRSQEAMSEERRDDQQGARAARQSSGEALPSLFPETEEFGLLQGQKDRGSSCEASGGGGCAYYYQIADVRNVIEADLPEGVEVTL